MAKSAYDKMMDYLARRSHAEAELTQKLLRDYVATDVEDAIAKAKERGWLLPPEEMAEQVASELNRKRKGHRFINQFLEQKGLPPVKENVEAEVAKAQHLLQAKFKHSFEDDGPLPVEFHEKAQRLLYNRGFSSETMTRILT